MWLSGTQNLAKPNGRKSGRRHPSSGRRGRASAVVVVGLFALSGCKSAASERGSIEAAARSQGESQGLPSGARLLELEARAGERLKSGTELPSRAEVVELADDLAVAAARIGPGARATRLSGLAADLRTRIWRVGHAEADAREAMELYDLTSKNALREGAHDEACRAALARAVVSAELARAPGLFYREVYTASKIFDGKACEPGFVRALKTLEAFRPAKEQLDALEASARRQRNEAGKQTTISSVRTVSEDDGGVVLAPALAEGAPPVKVVSIEPYGSKDRARVVVTLSGPTGYQVGELAGPRLFVDLQRTEPSVKSDILVGGLVERVRQAAHREGAAAEESTRIVLDLTSPAYRRIFYLPEPFRVIIDVATHPPERSSVVPGAVRPVSRIALDAGHGGADPGAVGPSGLREKEVTLGIAHLAAPVLSRELGILTLLTRDDDRLVPLDERAARANAFHADLFVSIHCNASDSSAAHGVMTFVLDTSRDEIAARVAARENATSLAATTQIASIASGLRLAQTSVQSSHFAELLQRSTMASLSGRFADASDQGVRAAGFFVLLGAEMPSVLFETSFISNSAEEKRLSTAEYRQKLADGIVNAVRAYRQGR